MHHFITGTYRGHRNTSGGYELYGTYHIEIVEPSKDGTPRVKVNGRRAKKVMSHSKQMQCVDGKGVVAIEASCCVSDDGYEDNRYPLDRVCISADPRFLVS